jgi:hypothetical protein
LNYIDASVKTELVAPEPKSEGLIEDKVTTLMEEQKQTIKIKGDGATRVIPPVIEDDIPDFT